MNSLENKINEVNEFLNRIESDSNSSSSSKPPKHNKASNDDELEKSLNLSVKKFVIVLLTVLLTFLLYFTQVIIINIHKGIWVGGGLIVTLIINAILIPRIKKIVNKLLKNKNFIRKIIKWMVIISVIVSTCFAHYPPTYIWASEKSEKFFSSLSSMMNTEDHNESNELTANLNENAESIDLNIEFFYDDNQNFVINKNDLFEKINDELRTDSYYNFEFSNGEFLYKLNTLFNSKSPVTNRKEYNKVQALEDSFINKKDYAKSVKNKIPYSDWLDLLPNEDDLLKIINEQEIHSNNYPNYQIYKKISNNYQRLALEYINQDSYSSTIKYYYLKSISYDIKSITYAETKSDYNCALNRIYYRFNDIKENCINTDEEMEKLSLILEELKKYK